MTLEDLISKHKFSSIKPVIIEEYPDQESKIPQYEKVYFKLLAMESAESDLKLMINFLPDEDKESSYHDTSGIGVNADGKPQQYAIEFLEWNKWLGMEIEEKTLENYSEEEIVAHSIHEMTFIDFDEDVIRKEIQEMNEQVEAIGNMSPEEREKQLIKWEELKKNLQLLGGSDEEEDDDEDADDDEDGDDDDKNE